MLAVEHGRGPGRPRGCTATSARPPPRRPTSKASCTGEARVKFCGCRLARLSAARSEPPGASSHDRCPSADTVTSTPYVERDDRRRGAGDQIEHEERPAVGGGEDLEAIVGRGDVDHPGDGLLELEALHALVGLARRRSERDEGDVRARRRPEQGHVGAGGAAADDAGDEREVLERRAERDVLGDPRSQDR